MNRQYVVSSQIASIGYDSATQTLEVEFPNQALYQYFGVAPDTYNELMNAESLGRFFGANIRGKYEYNRL